MHDVQIRHHHRLWLPHNIPTFYFYVFENQFGLFIVQFLDPEFLGEKAKLLFHLQLLLLGTDYFRCRMRCRGMFWKEFSGLLQCNLAETWFSLMKPWLIYLCLCWTDHRKILWVNKANICFYVVLDPCTEEACRCVYAANKLSMWAGNSNSTFYHILSAFPACQQRTSQNLEQRGRFYTENESFNWQQQQQSSFPEMFYP